jgi:hypothetical protein
LHDAAQRKKNVAGIRTHVQRYEDTYVVV